LPGDVSGCTDAAVLITTHRQIQAISDISLTARESFAGPRNDVAKMDRTQIIEQLVSVMSDVFDVDDLVVTDATSAEDIEEWDSLSHIRFMITVERLFKFKFRNDEIAELKNVGDLVTAIQKKLA
jgi:acyl carrier protein